MVAAYQGNSYYPDFEPQEYPISTLGEEGWSGPTSLGGSFGEFSFFDMIAMDKKHVALTGSIQYPPNETIYIINVETVTVVTDISLDFHCYAPFLYNNQYTCVKEGTDELWSLSFSEDFSEPTWSVVQSLPPGAPDTYYGFFLTQLDGMLTCVLARACGVGFCRRCCGAGGEQVPPSPLGWYFIYY